MSLTSVTLRSYQKHQKLTIDLDPKVTTIVGETDEGKSTIVRALGTVCLNQPSTIDLIKDGEDGYQVTLRVDGRKVKRTRTKSSNTYTLDGKVYHSFGRNQVPDDIANLLNVSDINFQWQLDSPFWIVESPAQLARNLNEIVSLEVMDKALSLVGKRKSFAATEVEVRKSDLTEARETLKELSYVPEFVKDARQLTTLEQELTESRSSVALLRHLVESMQSLDLDRDRWNSVVLCGSPLLKTARKTHALSVRVKRLRSVIKDATAVQKVVGTESPDLSEVEEARIKGDKHAENRMALDGLITELIWKTGFLKEQDKLLKEAENEFKDKTKGRCPICGKKI